MRINLSDILHRVLNESVSGDEVTDAIVNHRYVNLNYVDEDGSAVGNRLVQPYVYGRSTAGNPIVRVFQVSGDTLRKRDWKTLRLDRIISWKPRKQTFNLPPDMQGYKTFAYREDGDNRMGVIYAQAKFDNAHGDTLSVEREKTSMLGNLPKINTKNSVGPVPYAHQQVKKNIFTTQPNSKKYQMYQKNFADTENEFDRFNDDIWSRAEAEKINQDNQKINDTAPQPPKRNDGPVEPERNEEKLNGK